MYSSSTPTVYGGASAEAMVEDARWGGELGHQIGSGRISIAPAGHSVTHSEQPLQ